MQQISAQFPKFTNNLYNLKMTKKNLNKKMGRRRKQTFIQRRHTDEQQTHEKMPSIANYQRNANQNYSKVPPHTSQNGHHLKVYK